VKIAYLCSDVDVQVLGHQGCSVHVREFTHALVDEGHDVFIICSWPGESDIETAARIYPLEPAGYNQAMWEHLYEDPALWNASLDRDLKSILCNHWLQVEGARIIEREKPDVIYERYALFGFGGLQLSRRFNLPLILELNAPLCDQQAGYVKFPLIETARRMERRIIRGADALVALTPWLADWAAGLGADRRDVHVLPDAVSARLFRSPADGQSIRRSLGGADVQVIGFVGSFHKWHDLDGLIDAFSLLHRNRPHRRLLLVGDGHTRAALETKVQSLGLTNAVVFTGAVPHDEVPRYLSAMDVAVVPYRPIDGFFFSPMKLFESMAAGRPTVAAALGQIAEVIDDGRTGVLYPPGDNERLGQVLEQLLEEQSPASAIGAAAREYVLANHTWEMRAREVARIAGELINGLASGGICRQMHLTENDDGRVWSNL